MADAADPDRREFAFKLTVCRERRSSLFPSSETHAFPLFVCVIFRLLHPREEGEREHSMSACSQWTGGEIDLQKKKEAAKTS